MNIKSIEGFPGYFISDCGKVISHKFKKPRIMKTQIASNEYETVAFFQNGEKHHQLVHRLVAQAFIPNPDNLPEVHHKDKNRSHNDISNLEWCTRLFNLYDSYETMGPMRHFKRCKLVETSTRKTIGEFKSTREASNWAAENIPNVKKYMLIKHKENNGYELIQE